MSAKPLKPQDVENLIGETPISGAKIRHLVQKFATWCKNSPLKDQIYGQRSQAIKKSQQIKLIC